MICRFIILLLVCVSISCKTKTEKNVPENRTVSPDSLFNAYYQERIQLYPLEATLNGINTYNDKLPVDISESYRDTLRTFYQKYTNALKNYDRSVLSHNDQLSYDVLQWELRINLEQLSYHDNLMPINQFWSLPLTMGQLGSGSGNQPFKTVKDYENFLSRINGFSAWCDTAIVNMRKGLAMGITPPEILMQKVLPQLQNIISKDVTQSIFYTPVKNMDSSVTAADRERITAQYKEAISSKINGAYQRLLDFISNEYIPSLRKTAGISNIPEGNAYYAFLAKQWTTTDMTPDEIFDLGQREVERIRGEMENVMKEVGYTGTLKEFFHYVHTDKQFYPFKTADDVLNAYRSIEEREKPFLPQLFTKFPKTPFEIRQTEAFRAASASAEYNQGTPDGSRPGIFYVPVLDASTYNNISMEDLFLHEAIPGHHYQISLQQENTALPDFRKFVWYGAYGEGWALYTESLGKDLGLYKDPYQYFGSLSEEMHRALRLVVDVGMHAKGWTREQAIQYSLDNEAESEADITSEIERYMAIPGQALSYKVGQLKIMEIRDKAKKELGDKFNIAKFHDEILSDGCLPIRVLELKMDDWIKAQKE